MRGLDFFFYVFLAVRIVFCSMWVFGCHRWWSSMTLNFVLLRKLSPVLRFFSFKFFQIFFLSNFCKCLFFVFFDKFFTNFWQFFDNFLTNFWQIFDNFLTNFLQISDKFLTSFWYIFDKFLIGFSIFRRDVVVDLRVIVRLQEDVY